MYFIPWIAVSLKVLQVTVDCSLLLKDCNFSGLSHSGFCVFDSAPSLTQGFRLACPVYTFHVSLVSIQKP